MKEIIRLTSIVILLTIGNSSVAQVKKDAENSQDFPFLGRFPESLIASYAYNEFDNFTFPLSLNQPNPQNFEHEILSGERTAITYHLPKINTASTLNIISSIENELKKFGFKETLRCSGENSGCGFFFLRHVIGREKIASYYPAFKEFINLHNGDLRILAGKFHYKGEQYHALVTVAKSPYVRYTQYAIDAVKVGTAKVDKMVLTTENMGIAMSEHGKVQLHGIFFDNDSDVITAESQEALQTIAQYILAHPNKKYFVVGHTDTQGGFAYNQDLSSRRALAVSKQLIDTYKIGPSLLKSFGAAYASPNTTNSTETGRSNNRRVELVQVEKF